MYFGQIERSCLDGDLWSLYQTSPLLGCEISDKNEDDARIVPNVEPERTSFKTDTRPVKFDSAPPPLARWHES